MLLRGQSGTSIAIPNSMRKFAATLFVFFCLGCGQAPQTQTTASAVSVSPSALFVLQNEQYSAYDDAVVTSPGQGSNFLFSDTAGGHSGVTVTLGSGSNQTSGFFFMLAGQGYTNALCWSYNYNPDTHTLYLGYSGTSPNPQTSCNAVVDYTMPLVQS
jgi:hypothetical protein